MESRKVSVMCPVDAAYLAGLIDGEGTISLSRIHRGQNRQLVVTISSTERRLLDWAKNATGVGKITAKRTSSPHHSPGYTYCVANRQALALLSQVQLYLRSYKSLRSRLVLENYLKLTPRNGKYTAALLEARQAFEHLFSAISIRGRAHKIRAASGCA
jgi:LAGLIDADG DNA endonuclease family protein